MPTRDGVNILQRCPRLAASLDDATGGHPLVPIGRLDKASRGLLLLTTDPTLLSLLLRPSATAEGSAIAKEYHVVTAQRLQDGEMARLAKGVKIAVPNWGRAKPRVRTRPVSELRQLPRE